MLLILKDMVKNEILAYENSRPGPSDIIFAGFLDSFQQALQILFLTRPQWAQMTRIKKRNKQKMGINLRNNNSRVRVGEVGVKKTYVWKWFWRDNNES